MDVLYLIGAVAFVEVLIILSVIAIVVFLHDCVT